MKQALYSLHRQNITRALQQENTFIQAFLSVSGCQASMRKSEMSRLCFSRLQIQFDKLT